MSEVETKKPRGRETAGDMVRSLGLVLVGVLAIWFLAQPPDSDEQRIRVVDPAPAYSAFAADVPQVPVPGFLPAQWRPTSASVTSSPTALRVGYVTPSEQYAEYSASTGPREDFVEEFTGSDARRLDEVQVAGGTWEQYEDEDGSLSLVRSYGSATVVLGSKRASASLAELRTLAESLATR